MSEEITVETSPEGAGTDEIPCGQPLIHDEQPAMATSAVEPSSPVVNMAANTEPQPDSAAPKDNPNPPKNNTMFSPMAAGINYQIYNPFGFWPAQGQQLPSYPFAPMAPGPSWAMPPPAAASSYGGAAHPPFAPTATPPSNGLVPFS